MKKIILVLGLCLFVYTLSAQEKESTTSFKFGGFVKADFIGTWYQNGAVGTTSTMRDFHSPGQIPVGAENPNFDFGSHIKETRFNFGIDQTVLGKEVNGFLEFDFMLSPGGNEKVSNSFSPRVRHAYIEWDKFMIGQAWSTFMIVVLPDELDFIGAMDGVVFNRQPQIRYKLSKDWWFSLENPETTVAGYKTNISTVSENEVMPDIVARRNFSGEWGKWSIAGIARTLHVIDHSAFGFGVTTGGLLKVGENGDDFRFIGTYGHGLGRYLSAAFLSGAIYDSAGDLNAIETFNGYLAYNHYWKPQTLSSSFSMAAFTALHDGDLVSPDINKMSYSISGNLKWNPIPKVTFGAEYMYGYKKEEDGTDGTFHRMQFAAKYAFNYKHMVKK